MTPLAAVGWIVLAVWLVVLGVRMVLTEAVWSGVRDERTPRRVVRGLDALAVILTLALAGTLAAVILPPVLAG